jgi:hypothetical protein
MGELCGTYPRKEFWSERGWYPININITSSKIKRDVLRNGIDTYMAAWEKAINTESNKKKYGTIIILSMCVNNSIDNDKDHRFISCEAKTNKKSISGFAAIREGKYVIL